MAYITNNTQAARPAFGAVRGFFAKIGQMLETYAEVRSKSALIDYLYNLSDPELHALGITRDTIPHAVFNNRLGL
ncbi:hypothetical protein [Roseicitreum antarcticum]|uniref:DUF1127 domain-containing protein n=1 Tax=Roseicitreum antarcticum TaxID=564137 RepID=A0A1H3BDH7_9RHOB|nr:hypothetical protein [Roseicitreum antarcticum]SDX40003.1 hypothetical protein SAMN04488238_10817 [Roseicitreum antarcticum]